MKILTVPHKMLYRKVDPVDIIDKEINGIIDLMFLTMYSHKGIGLAANQVGIPLQIVVLNPRCSAMALINPVIVGKGEAETPLIESCLSIPGFSKSIDRSTSVIVKSLNRYGDTQDFEVFGVLARIIQHEVDHLKGILINCEEY